MRRRQVGALTGEKVEHRSYSSNPFLTGEPDLRDDSHALASGCVFHIGDAAGCSSPDPRGFCAIGTVRGVRPHSGGIRELDEYLIELSPFILGVYLGKDLVQFRVPAVPVRNSA